MKMLSFLCLTLLVLLVYLFLNRKYAYWKKRNVPFCKPTFFTGNVGSALILRTSISNICEQIYNDYKDCRYVGFFNMLTPAILVRDPQIVKDILVKNFQSYRNWIEIEDNVDPVMSLNPFVLHGPKWKSVRTILSPQFTSAKIKSIVSNIQLVNDKMIDYIKKELKVSKSLEIRQLTARFTGETVMSSAFGLDGRSFQDNYPDTFKIAAQISSKSKMMQLKQTLAIFFPTLRKVLRVTFLGDPVTEKFKNIIKDSIKYRDENKIIRKDYLGYLSKMKEKLLPYYSSDDDLVAHAFTFFLDGFETSSLTFLYALYELSQNEDIQNKAREEICAVLNKHGEVLSYEALHEMEYVECIIFETLRKNPVIKILSRVSIDDVVFPCPKTNNDGQDIVIKKGTQIFISLEGLHADSKYYPNPEIFDPDRFNEANKNSRPKYTYLSFGDGPKICLGKTFALTQIKLGLIAILSEFRLEINEKTETPLKQENIHFFMSPKSDIWLNFYPRL